MNPRTAPENMAEKLRALRLIPVIVIDVASTAVPLAQALVEGGLPCAEVTFRTAAAAAAMRAITEKFPHLLLGAGTVINPMQAEVAIAAGAQFIVSPGFSPAVADFCRQQMLPYYPGVCTPTDIQMALAHGLEVLKFFPAEASGGIAMLKALAAPFPNVQFIPTGGVEPDNLRSYLDFSAVLACGGSWMVKADLIKTGNFAEITRRVQAAVSLAAR